MDDEMRPVPGALLMLGGVQAGTADAAGDFELDVSPKNQQLSAVAPFRVRSTEFHVTGEYGETKETELVLGGPAGGVRVRVTSSTGERPARTSVGVMWADPESRARVAIDGVSVKGRMESRNVDGKGQAALDFIPPGPATVRVTAKGHGPEMRYVTVVADEWTEIEVRLSHTPLEERLREERVSFRFTDTPLDDAIGYVARAKGMSIILMPAAREGLSDAGITLTVDDDTVESALRALCDAAGDLTYRVDAQLDLVRIEARER